MTPARRILPVFVPHLGCPHACVFCDQRRISGAAAAPAPEEVDRRIREAEGREPLEVAFYGGSFTAVDRALQDALLGAVATDPDYRKRGLAAALVTKCAVRVMADGKTPLITCFTENAERLYKSLGFTDAALLYKKMRRDF